MTHMDRITEIVHAAARGTIAAMAMTGVRYVSKELGIVSETPPEKVGRRSGVTEQGNIHHQRVLIQCAHWGYGAVGGAVFGSLPDGVRRRAWAGPVYGLILWIGFEAAIAPAIGAQRSKTSERVALAGDHLLYGLVLSEIRKRPQS